MVSVLNFMIYHIVQAKDMYILHIHTYIFINPNNYWNFLARDTRNLDYYKSILIKIQWVAFS